MVFDGVAASACARASCCWSTTVSTLSALWRRVGYFVDKILKGAKALGIKISHSLLVQAAKLIERSRRSPTCIIGE